MINPRTATIVLRAATPDDDHDLHRLSQLDSAAPLPRPAIMADVDGVPLAALSLEEGRVVADPFQSTTTAVGLLRARSAALQGPATPYWRRRRGRRFAKRALRA